MELIFLKFVVSDSLDYPSNIIGSNTITIKENNLTWKEGLKFLVLSERADQFKKYIDR